MKKAKTNQKIGRRILLMLLLILLVIYILYEMINLIIKPTDIVTVEKGKIYSESQAEGYIIREEEVLKGENYKNGISQIKAEGEKVAIKENVFRYYTKDEDSLITKIQELDNEIAQTQSKENNIWLSDVKVIENEIETKINEIYMVNDIKKVKEYKSNIDEYIKKKTRIIGENSPSGSHLKSLIQKRSEYENKLNSGSEYMKANISGMVSYKVDGLESVLTPDSINTITEDFLNDLKLKTGQIVSSISECGKIVNNYYCYIASVVNKEKVQDLEEGKSIKLRLINGDEIPATVEQIREDKDKNIIVFKITKDVEELIEYRKINYDIIYWSYSGLKVPNSTLIEENGLNYVIRNRAGYTDKILVKLEKQNDTYSIIDEYTTEELKELGWTTSEIINKKSIGIYDEILVNPKDK